jgi:acetyl esterase/lipase
VRRDVAYGPLGEAQTYDVHLPPGATAGGAGGALRPGVLVVHGGAWWTESKERYSGLSDALARRGYVVATTNYRLVPEGRFPAAARDVRCALAHLRAHAGEHGLDPARVALLGYSAGGHLASLVAVVGDDAALQGDCEAGPTGPPQAVVSGAGPQDLGLLGWAPQVHAFLGGTPEATPDVYREASPVHRVRAGATPPFLFLHGDQDLYVPLEHSLRMAARLREAGGQAELLRLPGGGHAVNPGTRAGSWEWESQTLDSPEAWLALTDFLARTLGAP